MRSRSAPAGAASGSFSAALRRLRAISPKAASTNAATSARDFFIEQLFVNGHDLVGGNVPHLANDSAWEADGQPVDLLGAPQSEVSIERVLRKVGGLAANLLELFLALRLDLDFGAEAAAVALGAMQAHFDPRILVAAVVAQQQRPVLVIDDEDTDAAVVQVVREGSAAADVFFLKHRAADPAHLEKAIVRILLPEKKVLHRPEVARILFILEGAAVGREQIELPVVVVVEERSSPANIAERHLAKPFHVGDILEPQPARLGGDPAIEAQVREQGVLLGNPVGDEDVEVAVAIPVAHGESHGAAILVDPRLVRDVLEAAVVQVEIEFVLGDVVRDVEVRPAVAIEIGPGGGEAAPRRIIDFCQLRDLRERSIAVVVEE